MSTEANKKFSRKVLMGITCIFVSISGQILADCPSCTLVAKRFFFLIRIQCTELSASLLIFLFYRRLTWLLTYLNNYLSTWLSQDVEKLSLFKELQTIPCIFFFSLGKNKQWFGGMWDGNMGIAGHWRWWQGCGWVCLGQLVCCCSPWLCSVLSGGFSTLLCEILNKGRKYFSQWILWNQWKCALITGWVSVLSVIHPVLFLWACFFPL